MRIMAQEHVENFVSSLLPDDVPTQEEIEAMDEAETEYARGECYSLKDLTLNAKQVKK
jgi:hypothetical protein